MKPNIRLSGIVSLREDYDNPKNKKYYAVLSVTIKADDIDDYTPQKANFEVSITAEHYNFLRKKFAESNAEEPVLRINLELILDGVCWD
mgnify:CR=1 FL=1